MRQMILYVLHVRILSDARMLSASVLMQKGRQIMLILWAQQRSSAGVKIKYELGCRRKTVLAPLRKIKGSSKGTTTKSASLVKKKVSKQKDYESFTVDVEWICDSGAGHVVCSDRALQEHGLPVKKWMRMRTKSKRPMCFDTGGGEVEANLSLLCESNLFGKREA